MEFFLRAPKFPVLIDSGTRLYLISGNTETDSDLQKETFEDKSSSLAIDVTSEGFAYSQEMDVISPLTLQKQNTKKAFIELYNSRRPVGVPEYKGTSLSNKRFDKLFAEIASLVREQH